MLQVSGQRVVRSPGVAVGVRAACGARSKKRLNWLLDSASASSLVFPGRCVRRTWKWCEAAIKNRVRSRAMRWGSLHRLASHERTTAWLSQ